jgi:riboflavin kinase/FMN adenylyltransferase
MQLVRGLYNLRPEHHGCVATIGNFDGVHLGHQAVLGQLLDKASELRLPACLISFEPYPQEYFSQQCPPRLTRFREKFTLLNHYNLARMLCIRFDQAFAQQTADQFIQQVLVAGLGVKHLVIGDDFRFGKDRAGDFELLQRSGEQYGFSVARMLTYEEGGERVSSTRIRQVLEQGDLEQVKPLLGRPYRMSGRVAHGDKRGRTIGFPTANIHLHRRASPLSGVYAVEMYGIDGEPVPGVANIGIRPTVNGTRAQLEVHLFDFDGDIYGCHVQVEFHHKIRDEQKFDSFEALKAQIHRDSAQARAYFAI